jgi:hypothetical protein
MLTFNGANDAFVAKVNAAGTQSAQAADAFLRQALAS